MANILSTQRQLWDSAVLGQGYVERTITKDDPEVKLYDVTVSTARASDGRLNIDADFFVWTCPVTSFARIINKFIPRLKLYDNTGTELPEGAIILFKLKTDAQVRGVPFASIPYANFRRLTVAQQQDEDLNSTLAVSFDLRNPDNSIVNVLDINPNWQLVLAVAGTSAQLDKDQPNTVIEFDIGIRTQ